MKRVALVLLVALTACGGGGETSSIDSAPTPSASASSDEATVRQYASLIAEQETDLQQQIEQARDCGIAFTDTCRITALSLRYNAETLNISLDGATKPGVPAYIGPVPAELDSLVADTKRAALAIVDQYEAEVSTCGTDCIGAHTRYGITAGRLADELRGWSPYL